jgi:hypothetical protein
MFSPVDGMGMVRRFYEGIPFGLYCRKPGFLKANGFPRNFVIYPAAKHLTPTFAALLPCSVE